MKIKEFNQAIKQRRDKKCRYFNGTSNGECENGIEYPKARLLPCFGEGDSECVSYSPLNAEELAAKEAEHLRYIDLTRRGLSTCCEAELDVSQVIPSGKYKNHGPRFCSKCKRLCFMV